MIKHIKVFETHDDYVNFMKSDNVFLPNVSYCKNNIDVHYNPLHETRVLTTFNVESISDPTRIYFYVIEDDETITGELMFEKIEIDNVEISISDIDANEGFYQFETTGDHTVSYTLKDNTKIPTGMFYQCGEMTTITLPDTITTIGDWCFAEQIKLLSINIPNRVVEMGFSLFADCDVLTTLTIPSSVQTIGNAFGRMWGLETIYFEGTTPPTIDNLCFDRTDCIIYVPSQSVEEYKTAEHWSTYAGMIQANPND